MIADDDMRGIYVNKKKIFNMVGVLPFLTFFVAL